MSGDEQFSDQPRPATGGVWRLRHALKRYFQARLKDDAEADDLVQEVFTRMLARGPGSRIENVDSYAFQVASNILVDRARRRTARSADGHVEFDPDRHSEHDLDPYRHLQGKQELRAATAALLSLPVRTRQIFILHRLEGMKYREVSEQLGISVSAVEKHMMRAIQHLTANCGGSVG